METQDRSLESIIDAGLEIPQEDPAPEGVDLSVLIADADVDEAALEESDGNIAAEGAYTFARMTLEHVSIVTALNLRFSTEADIAPKVPKINVSKIKAFLQKACNAIIQGLKTFFAGVASFFRKLWSFITGKGWKDGKGVDERVKEAQAEVQAAEKKVAEPEVKTKIEAVVEQATERRHMVLEPKNIHSIAYAVKGTTADVEGASRVLQQFGKLIAAGSPDTYTEEDFGESSPAALAETLKKDMDKKIEAIRGTAEQTVEFSLTMAEISTLNNLLPGMAGAIKESQQFSKRLDGLVRTHQQIGTNLLNKINGLSEKNPDGAKVLHMFISGIQKITSAVTQYCHAVTLLTSKLISDLNFYLAISKEIAKAAGTAAQAAA